jgi:hypothetical protein
LEKVVVVGGSWMMKIGWFLVVKVVSYGGFVLVRVEKVVVKELVREGERKKPREEKEREKREKNFMTFL